VTLPAQPKDAGVEIALTDAITQLRRVLRRGIREDISWESLPMAQVELMQLVEESPGLRASEVGTRLRLATSTVSTLVSQMTTAGLLLRSSDPSDRRASHLELTAAGRERLDGWREAHERLLSAAFRRLRSSHQRALVSAVPALVALTESLAEG